MRFSPIKAVIFDFDGTLVDSMPLWKEIDTLFLAKNGHEVPDGLQKEIAGMSFSETADYFRTRFNIRQTAEEIKCEWGLLSRRMYGDKVRFKDCAVKLIDTLRAHDIKCAVGSSNEKELITEYLENRGLLDRFSTVMTGCEAGRGKPFPDLFLQIARRLGTRPSEMMVVDDILEGVVAGKRAGMKTVAVHENGYARRKVLEKEADKYIMSLCEISAVINDRSEQEIVFKG